MLEKIALSIGNSAYAYCGQLRAPGNDARAFGQLLVRNGFRLIGDQAHLDLEASEMRRLIEEFSGAISTNSLALFFYSGHGSQVDGANYLIPVSARITAARALHINDDLVNVDRVLTAMREARSQLNVVILDACRTNPLSEQILYPGLAEMSAPPGTIIFCATQPKCVAYDGAGDYSPFTEALLQCLEPGMGIRDYFDKVADTVTAATNRKQIPWCATSALGGRFELAEGDPLGETRGPETVRSGPGIRPAPQSLAPPIPAIATAAVPPRNRPEWVSKKLGQRQAPAARVEAALFTPIRPEIRPQTGFPSTITDAIAAAEPGATIKIPRGRYREAIRVDKPLTLQAERAGDVTIESAGEFVVGIVSSGVRIEGLKIQCGPGQTGILIAAQDALIERTEIACALGPAATRSLGIDVRDNAQASVSNCSIKNAGIGLRANGASSQLTAQGTKVTVDGEDAANEPWGLHATAGATALVEKGEFRNQTVGMVVDSGAALTAAGCKLSNHQLAAYAEGRDTKLEIQDSQIAASQHGIVARDISDAVITKCNFDYKVTGVQLAGAAIQFHTCKRIAAEVDSGVAFLLDGASSVSLTGCRLFRGAAAVRAQAGARIEIAETQLYSFLDAAILVPKDATVDLSGCQIYKCLSALDCGGQASVQGCKIYDHRGSGIVSYGAIELIYSDVYNNAKHGLELSRGAAGKVDNCQIFQNNAAGILADHASVDVKRCELAQNKGPAILASGASGRANVTASDVRGNFDSTALVGQYGGYAGGGNNQTPPEIDLPERERPTSDHNVRNIGVGIFAKYGDVFNTVQDFVRRLQIDNGYQLDGTWPSDDGKSVQHILSKRLWAVVPLKPLTGAARLQTTLKSNDMQSSNVNVPYELKITLAIEQSEAVRDIDRVWVTAIDEERIDPQNTTKRGIGSNYAAPSHLYQPGGGLGMKIVTALPAHFPYREPQG
jgi:Caspase domain/Right handed beta helix region